MTVNNKYTCIYAYIIYLYAFHVQFHADSISHVCLYLFSCFWCDAYHICMHQVETQRHLCMRFVAFTEAFGLIPAKLLIIPRDAFVLPGASR